MSQYEDDDEDSRRGGPRPARKERIVVEEKGYSTTQIALWVFCCCIVVGTIIFFIVAIVYFNREDNFQHHMNTVIDELINQNTQQTDSKNMVSFSALAVRALNKARTLIGGTRKAICYTELLSAYSPPGNGQQQQGPPPLTVVADQLSTKDENNTRQYALDFKITMEFDVDASNYVLNSQHLDQSQRYMTLSYLITSTYTRFSTIKLVESGLDTRQQRLIRTKEIILCSNNPLMNAKPCVATNVGEALASLFIKNTKLATMSKLVPWIDRAARFAPSGDGGGGKPRSTQAPVARSHGGSGDSDERAYASEQYDIVLGDSTINNYKAEEDYTRDVRFYNVEFYAPVTPADGNARFQSFQERIVLTVRPNKCK